MAWCGHLDIDAGGDRKLGVFLGDAPRELNAPSMIARAE
jgi:hypothetical protein